MGAGSKISFGMTYCVEKKPSMKLYLRCIILCVHEVSMADLLVYTTLVFLKWHVIGKLMPLLNFPISCTLLDYVVEV